MKYRYLKPVRVRVTPDPAQAAALEKRMRELRYVPEGSPFHRDQVQQPLPSLLRKQAQ
jgi:hypothetical protein